MIRKEVSFANINSLIILIILLFILIIKIKTNILKYEINLYKKYIIRCSKIKKYEYEKKSNKGELYLSIILPVYNMEKYIKRALLSILNQTFKNFEIIIINDSSNDDTNKIIQKFKKNVDKIKILEHNENLGTYISRIDGVLLSKGQYILFIDPDDILLNPYLFQKIYEINNKYNLDIIEFVVYYEEEGNNKIIIPDGHRLNHFHGFEQKIIYQSELSDLLFYEPKNKNKSRIICRPIWNKVIKKYVLLKTINFIGNDINKNKYFNYAEDTIMNIINFQFANNYSNINIPGYLYNIRKKGISHGKLGTKYKIAISKNILFYFKLLYKYIKYFEKDRNILYNELKDFISNLFSFKIFNITESITDTKQYLNNILIDKNISIEFKEFIRKISFSFN